MLLGDKRELWYKMHKGQGTVQGSMVRTVATDAQPQVLVCMCAKGVLELNNCPCKWTIWLILFHNTWK